MPPPLSLLLAGVMPLLAQSVVMVLALLLAEAELLLLLLAMALALLALALALLALAMAMVGWPYQWRRGAVTGSCMRIRVLVCVGMGRI